MKEIILEKKKNENGWVITGVRVSYTRKVALADYESAQATVTLEASVDGANANVEDVIAELFAMATEGVKAKLLPLVEKRRPQVNGRLMQKFAGKEVEHEES